MKKIQLFAAATFALHFLVSCSGNSEKSSANYENKVIQHVLSDADQLNPLNYNTETTGYINTQVFQTLLTVNFKTLELVPQLATARPELKELPNGKLGITYQIRPEATWDDNKPITANDVAFSLKAIKNPLVDCARIRPYYEFIEDIQIDPQDPKKFTFICKEKYMIAEASSGDFPILPATVYDEQNLMNEFTLPQLTSQAAALANNPKIKQFAEQFNSEKFKRQLAVGSGPYMLERWETNQRLILKRKENWWGNKAQNKNESLEAFPNQIVYETINDLTTAVVALKGEKLDVMRGIPPKDFVEELPKSEKFSQYFNTFSPPLLAYDYIALNTHNPKLTDVKVRQALAYLTDVDRLIKTNLYGLGERTVGFVHPTNKFYNKTLTPYAFDPQKAKQLLQEAGWKDTNGNGTVDKNIDGKTVEMELELNYNTGNQRREETSLIMQEAARSAGVKINIVNKDFSVLTENLKKHQFEMVISGLISSVLESDPKQSWHTESANNGGNYSYFGNAQSDKIIDDLRKELDEQKRGEYYNQLQAIIHQEVPCIFTVVQKERIAIHKKYGDTPPVSTQRPGYNAMGFKLLQSTN